MANYKLGIQAHSVREAFAGDPADTIKRLKEMGYTGLEIPMGPVTSRNEDLTGKTASFYKKILDENEMECYGLLTSWENIQPENIEDTLKYNEEIGSPFLVIGSVPENLVNTMDDVNETIRYMLEVQKIINKEGIVTGYHNHDTDFFNVIDGKTYFEHVFDNTPEDYVMLLDTGNAKAGGFDAIELLNKYPGRSPFLHVKGYSQAEGYLAYIGQDDFDWEAVIECALKVGKSTVFDIEFGQRGAYDPFERAENGLHVIRPILDKLTKQML